MAVPSLVSARVRKWRASRLTAAERANLRAAVTIPAIYTASLGGHTQSPERAVPRDGDARGTLRRVLRAIFG